MKCTKRRTDGQPCGGQAVTGTDACRSHAGRSLAEQKARGQVVVELRRWGVDDVAEDPGELLLRLMTVTEWNRQAYQAEIDRILAETGSHLSEALVGDSIVVDSEGSPHKVGEYIRGIVQLEAQERDRAITTSIKAVAAGIAERQLRIAERYVSALAQAQLLILQDLGIDPSDPRVTRVVATRLRELEQAS